MDHDPEVYRARAVDAVAELYNLLAASPLPGQEFAHVMRVARAESEAGSKVAAWLIVAREAAPVTRL